MRIWRACRVSSQRRRLEDKRTAQRRRVAILGRATDQRRQDVRLRPDRRWEFREMQARNQIRDVAAVRRQKSKPSRHHIQKRDGAMPSLFLERTVPLKLPGIPQSQRTCRKSKTDEL